MLIIWLIIMANSFGQTLPEVNFATMQNQIFPEEVSYQYLLADKVFLRDCPTTDCKKRAVLDIGLRLILWEKSKETKTINGITSHWYRVSTGEEKGWIWGGFIAQHSFGSQAEPNVKFVFGLENAVMDPNGFPVKTYQMRAFKEGIQLDKIVFAANEIQPWGVKNLGNKGLYNVEDIITLFSPCKESFGCATNTNYMFWNNGKFYHVANLVGTLDAAYSESEIFIFPSDMEGKTGKIIKKSGKLDPQQVLEGETAKVKRKMTHIYYIWDGYKLLESDISPTILAYEIAS